MQQQQPQPQPQQPQPQQQQQESPCGERGSGGGSSSQGRKSTLPVQALVHAFHCTNAGCQQKTCPDTKKVMPLAPRA